MEIAPLVYSDEETDVRARTLGRQRITAWRTLAADSMKIGEGGFGKVYRVRREYVEKLLEPEESTLPTLDDFVAVKIMSDDYVSSWKNVLRAAKRETRMLINVQEGCESHNLQCYFADQVLTLEDKEVAYIVITKYIEGKTLLEYIAAPPGARASVLAHILNKLALAFDYLHSSFPPIVHGDIKTNNILIDNNNEPWVIDFGFSCMGEVCTQDYSRRGTPLYMSYKKLLNYVWYNWKVATAADQPEWTAAKNAFKKNKLIKKSDLTVSMQDTIDADRWALAVVTEYLMSARRRSNMRREELKYTKNLVQFLNDGYATTFPTGVPVSDRHVAYFLLYTRFVEDCCLSVLNYPMDPGSWPTLKAIAAAAAQYEIMFKKIEDDMPVLTYHARINASTNPRFLLASIGAPAAPPCIWDRTKRRPHCKCTFASVNHAVALFSTPRYLAGKAMCPVCGDIDDL